jgi:predicted nucleotidyltransferase
MSTLASRPAVPAPEELYPLLARVEEALHPLEVWLFGSRARGDARPDSDWDILAVLPDHASEHLKDPLLAWEIANAASVRTTLLSTTRGELEALWGRPNTLGYDLAREGVRLIVR